MSPPTKKRKTKKPSPTPESYSISSFPDDLILSCLARVSILYYPTLSLVSKKFRSLIASPEIYKVRSLLGLTESCLYVFLRFNRHSDQFSWFTLRRIPDTKKKKKKHILVPILFPNCSPQARRSSVVTIGYSIYFIGGWINSFPCSNVSILDCRSHTWHQAPDMQVVRGSPGAHVIDGKIYVVGGPNSIEVFDPKTQIWNYVSSPGNNIFSSVIDGKICMYTSGTKGVAYNPEDGTNEPIEWELCKGFTDYYPHCVVQNMLFYYDDKVFKWFDTKARLWRNLKGLEKMVRRIAKDSSVVELADYGGKMVVLWDRDVPSSGNHKKKVIWCGVIAVERRDSEEEIWGTVEWFDVVLTVPLECCFKRVLATTL